MTETYSVAEAAKHLHLSTQTIRAWIKQARIVAIKLPNGRLIIPHSEIERICTGVAQ